MNRNQVILVARRMTDTPTRRKTARRKKRPGRYLHALLVIVIVCAGIYCAKAVIAKAFRPIGLNRVETREVGEIQKQMSTARAENIQLKGEIADISTPQGKEAEARKLGWVKKGETAIVVAPAQKSSLETARPQPKKSFWQNAADAFTGLFRRGK